MNQRVTETKKILQLYFKTRENEDDDVGTLDSAVGSGSLADSTSLNTEVRSSDASNAVVRMFVPPKKNTLK